VGSDQPVNQEIPHRETAVNVCFPDFVVLCTTPHHTMNTPEDSGFWTGDENTNVIVGTCTVVVVYVVLVRSGVMRAEERIEGAYNC
jgi:hypothetical protein